MAKQQSVKVDGQPGEGTTDSSTNFQFSAAPYPPLRRFPASTTVVGLSSGLIGSTSTSTSTTVVPSSTNTPQYALLSSAAHKLGYDDKDRLDATKVDKSPWGDNGIPAAAAAATTTSIEIGQVVLLVLGPDAGKLATIIDVVTEDGQNSSSGNKNFIIDGPQEMTGVTRQTVPYSHFQLTDLAVKVQRNVRQKTLVKSWTEAGIMDKWEAIRRSTAVSRWEKKSNKDGDDYVNADDDDNPSLNDGPFVYAALLGPSSLSHGEPFSSVIPHNDPSFFMMYRATSGYSMNISTNMKLLAANHNTTELPDVTRNKVSLLHVWSWVERIETISSSVESEQESMGYNDVSTFNWPAKGLLDAGVWQLLGYSSAESSDGRAEELSRHDEILFSETLNCNIYDSHERRAALAACGWAAKYDLNSAMKDCEQMGELERSAALALWHGNIEACVDALTRNAKIIKSDSGDYPSRYAESLEMTAMCIAGFGGKTELQMRVWKTACESLLQRGDLTATAQRNSTAYLLSMCQFLLTLVSGEGLSVVLEDSNVSLCDRVALACRFLPQIELKDYLLRCVSGCMRNGDIEGLVVTGLSKTGIQILQAYMDCHVDVQSTCLVVSRVVIPSQWTLERKLCVEWVESYRNLLNKWRMWETRATFDVEKAELLRAMKSRDSAAGGNQFGQQRRMQNERNRVNYRTPDPDVVSVVPASIEVRCNYCSSKLSLKQNQGVTNAWLSQMQQQLNCCPQCRKPLPRCSVCLLSMSVLNPYTELMRERRSNSSTMASLSSLPLAEQFSWCPRCRHGGHAGHMQSWWSVNNVCPVSGCDCVCEISAGSKK